MGLFHHSSHPSQHSEAPVPNAGGAFKGDVPLYTAPGYNPNVSHFKGDVPLYTAPGYNPNVSHFKGDVPMYVKPTPVRKKRPWYERPFLKAGKFFTGVETRQSKRAQRRLDRHPRLAKTRRNLRRFGMPAYLTASVIASLLTLEPGPLAAYFATLSAGDAELTAAAMSAAVDAAAEETEITFVADVADAPLFPSQSLLENEDILADLESRPYVPSTRPYVAPKRVRVPTRQFLSEKRAVEDGIEREAVDYKTYRYTPKRPRFREPLFKSGRPKQFRPAFDYSPRATVPPRYSPQEIARAIARYNREPKFFDAVDDPDITFFEGDVFS